MNPIRQLLCGATLAVCVAAGCASAPGIEGRWSGTAPFDSGGTAKVTYEFLPDGVVTMTATKNPTPKGKAPTPGFAEMMLPGLAEIMLPGLPGLSVHVVGIYTTKNDVLTIKLAQVTLLDKRNREPTFKATIKRQTQIIRFKLNGQTLSIDKLDGAKPIVLERQAANRYPE
jgi:hypothetical protein